MPMKGICSFSLRHSVTSFMAKRRRAGLGIDFPKPKFSSPTIMMTQGVGSAFSDEDPSGAYLARHFHGDWGDIGEDDQAQNDASIKTKDMILSAYTTESGTKIWIITDPGHEVTTILLPEEY